MSGGKVRRVFDHDWRVATLLKISLKIHGNTRCVVEQDWQTLYQPLDMISQLNDDDLAPWTPGNRRRAAYKLDGEWTRLVDNGYNNMRYYKLS